MWVYLHFPTWWHPVKSLLFVEDAFFFSIIYFWLLCQKSGVHRCVDLCLEGVSLIWFHWSTCLFQSTSRLSYTMFGHISKGLSILSQEHLLIYVHSNFMHNIQKLDQPKCISTEEWIKNIWYIYTVEYYSAVKSNDIMKFASKLI